MRILATGGVGNIGSQAVAELVVRGHDVITYDLSDKTLDVPHIHVVGDILDQEKVTAVIGKHRVDAIIHLASILQFGCEDDPAKAITDNVDGTLRVLKAARATGVNRVILAGTLATYGSTTGEIDEASPVQADAPLYGVTKLIGEKMAYRYNTLHRMDCVALRFGAVLSPKPVLSPGIAAVLARIFDAASGEDIVIDGVAADEKRHYAYTKDIAVGIALAVETASTKSSLFNIAGGEDCYVSFQQVADIVRNHAPGCGTVSFTGRSGQRGRMDISRARRELNYAPRYTLDAAIGEIVQSRLEDGHNPSSDRSTVGALSG